MTHTGRCQLTERMCLSVVPLAQEMHYDNHRAEDGLRDSSGFRLWYTHALRAFDAGMLSVGRVNNDLRSVPGRLGACRSRKPADWLPSACVMCGVQHSSATIRV
jgi:hypothetical protein